MYASACHTFSNFVSNSRKLKFRPIIISLPKPTFSWYVLQVKSIAFKKFLSFSTYTVSKHSRCSSACPCPGLCFPGNSSHSAIVTVSLSLLLSMGWAPRAEVLTLGAAPCRAALASLHCGDLLGSTPPQAASSSPQQWPAGSKCFLQASSSVFGLSDPEWEKL